MVRLALLADLGPSEADVTEFVLLALFDLTDGPKLLDVVEVGSDRMTGFADKPLLPLGHGADVIRIDSDHFNSEEDFVNTELIFVRNGRFQSVGGVFTYDLKTCTFRLTETPNVPTAADPGHPYNRIMLTVTEKVELEDDRAHCDAKKVPRPFVRTFRAVYRWNAHRQAFVTTSRDLDKLDEENKRFNTVEPALPANH